MECHGHAELFYGERKCLEPPQVLKQIASETDDYTTLYKLYLQYLNRLSYGFYFS